MDLFLRLIDFHFIFLLGMILMLAYLEKPMNGINDEVITIQQK